ncbi:MAG: hypothetical protein H7X99_10230 [Saprospiraceae bacterium]|nr:hypothetical protein [Saprospiraceae bacterium]
MSHLKYFSIILVVVALTCGNNTDKLLDGKSFMLTTWDVNHPEKLDKDLLIFKNGMMDSEACHQYGFSAAAYKSKIENDKISFSGTISSATEGTIRIDGNSFKNKIEGTMLWKKAGQAEIKYAFKGYLSSD